MCNGEGVTYRARTWYGASAEVTVEDQRHVVKVGSLLLPHPPLVNLLLRQDLPEADRLRFGGWHELGHLQTLPLAVVPLLLRRPGASHAATAAPWRQRLARAALRLMAHHAAWEIAAESYVMLRGGRRYRSLYRNRPRWLIAFLLGMAILVLLPVGCPARMRTGRAASGG